MAVQSHTDNTTDEQPTHKARVFVPTEKDDGQTATEVRRMLIDEYGGATSYEATGSWAAPSGDVITEQVTVVEALGQIDEEYIKKVANLVKAELNEETVLFEIEQARASFV